MTPENQHFERKSLRKVTGKTAAWFELALDCLAFANAQGGSLLIGIEDGQNVPPPCPAVPTGLVDDFEQKCGMGAQKKFEVFNARTCRKIMAIRLELLGAGFDVALVSTDYGTTISVANKLLQAKPEEDDKLLWYDQTLTRKDAKA